MNSTTASSVGICLLGAVEIRGLAGASPVRLSGATLELFAYLVSFHGRSLRRDHLAELLWEDAEPERSRAALNTALWRVRQSLQGLAGVNVQSDARSVRLELDPEVHLDTMNLKATTMRAARTFDRETGLPEPLRNQLGEVLATTEGLFLDGSTSTWALVEREEYFNLRLRGYTMLMQDSGIRGDYDEALSHGRRILAADPFREAVQCQMLCLLMLSGRRALAIQHYRDYEALLKRELGIAPMAESRAMLRMIRDDSPPADTVDLFGARATPTAEGFGQFLGEIDRVRRSVYRAMVTAEL